IMEIENKLRELLLPVLGLDTVEEVPPDASLVTDLGADSIDFVEIIYLIEQHFGVILKTDHILPTVIDRDTLFHEGKLTAQGVSQIETSMPGSSERYKEGMTKLQLFSALTVSDLAHIIQYKKNEGEQDTC
ncbi:MAG: acyl carrier protein, partial [bacterium]|nr:acyl carrier protein [bacterium]